MGTSRGLAVVAGVLSFALASCAGPPAPAAPDAAAATGTPTAAGSSTSLPATGIGDRSSPPAAGEDWLAYQGDDFRIRLVRPGGTDDQALDGVTVGPEDNPDWSPDGMRLTFVGSGDRPGSNAGLWVIGVDGRGLTRLVDCAVPCQYLDDPAWSPDGSQILYSRMAPGTTTGGTLEAVDVSSRRVTTVLRAQAGEFFAGVRYAPDGKAAVLEWVHASKDDYDEVEGVSLARVDLRSTPPALSVLTDPLVFAQTADWSPEGDLIVYAALPEPGGSANDLFPVRPDGSRRRRLTTLAGAGGGALYPDFTGDGSAVVFLGADASGKPRFRSADVTSGEVSPAVGALAGVHPRSRPVP